LELPLLLLLLLSCFQNLLSNCLLSVRCGVKVLGSVVGMSSMVSLLKRYLNNGLPPYAALSLFISGSFLPLRKPSLQ